MKSMPFLRPIGLPCAVAFLGFSLLVRGGERGLTDLSRSPHAVMYMPDMGDVKWNGGLFGERFEVCRTTMVPHLWEIFRSDTDSHAWANYRIAAGLQEGKFSGPPFNDGDFLKWFEALAQIYAVTRDPVIDRQMDEIIAVIAKAQRDDGYLHTRTIIPQRQGEPGAREFADRDHFETYNMGHLMTAACVHYRATGKTTLLACARKAADYIHHLCQTAPADLARNAICPSHYMGVAELYRTTREPRYLELAKQLIEIRSLVPPDVGSDMNQDRVPFRAMHEAVGHAVRANYLYAGATDVFAEDGDRSLLSTLLEIANDVATQKLAITGMTGAVYDGASPDGSPDWMAIKPVHQSYGRDYQLPNLAAYNESCATVGYALWSWRMLAVTGEARFADLFEQALYNGVLPGISLDGKSYFYVNPLRKLKEFNWPLRWSRTRTPNIQASFCCPPNVVRTIAEAHNYVYALGQDALWVNLYAASTLETAWTDGSRIKLRQETDYPWNGAIRLTLAEAPARTLAFRLRIPGWLHDGAATVKVNGQTAPGTPRRGTYFEVKRTWKAGDVVEIAFDFHPAIWEANPLVEETLGQVAIKYGPLVYCAESADLPAGMKLTDITLPVGRGRIRMERQSAKIGSTNLVTLKLPAVAWGQPAWSSSELYRETSSPAARNVQLTLVPYFAWGNRDDADMTVWLPTR
jgi:uncharacterized protein